MDASLCDVDRVKPWVLLAVAACLPLASCALRPPLVDPSPSVAANAHGITTCTWRPAGTPARPVEPPEGTGVPTTGTVRVTLDLAGRPVVLDLDRAKAPCAVASMESLVEQGFHDGVACHRLATRGLFILQCGDPTGTGDGGPGYRFDDEIAPGTTYPAGTVAMANAGPHTNGSQFFLVYGDSPLAPQFTVLGHLDAASTQVIADLAEQGHDSAFGDSGHPHAPATITRATLG